MMKKLMNEPFWRHLRNMRGELLRGFSISEVWLLNNFEQLPSSPIRSSGTFEFDK